MPNWYDPKRVIVYESSNGPMQIDPANLETGHVLRVGEDVEKTLTLQFPHPDGACNPRSNKVAMVTAPAIWGFGEKTGNWHYAEESKPKDAPVEEILGLRGFTTAELAQEVKRREEGSKPPPKPSLDNLPATAHVEQPPPRIAPSPPPAPVDPEVEAKIAEQKQKAEAAAKADAKFVKIKRKRGKKWITIARIRPESMKEGDKIIGIVALKEPEAVAPAPTEAPEEPEVKKEEVPAEV